MIFTGQVTPKVNINSNISTLKCRRFGVSVVSCQLSVVSSGNRPIQFGSSTAQTHYLSPGQPTTSDRQLIRVWTFNRTRAWPLARTTDNQQPTTNLSLDLQPHSRLVSPTDNRQPATDNQQPTTNLSLDPRPHSAPGLSHGQPATSNRQLI